MTSGIICCYHIDPGVNGLKRLRLTPKLLYWFVDASHFSRRRRRDSFSTAIRPYGWNCRKQSVPQFKLEWLQVEHSTAVSTAAWHWTAGIQLTSQD